MHEPHHLLLGCDTNPFSILGWGRQPGIKQPVGYGVSAGQAEGLSPRLLIAPTNLHHLFTTEPVASSSSSWSSVISVVVASSVMRGRARAGRRDSLFF